MRLKDFDVHVLDVHILVVLRQYVSHLSVFLCYSQSLIDLVGLSEGCSLSTFPIVIGDRDGSPPTSLLLGIWYDAFTVCIILVGSH